MPALHLLSHGIVARHFVTGCIVPKRFHRNSLPPVEPTEVGDEGFDHESAAVVQLGFGVAETAELFLLREQSIDPARIGAVYVGSESHPYAVKPSGTVVAEALGIGPVAASPA